MKRLLIILWLLLLAFSGKTAVVSFTATNSFGQPDTNYFLVYPISTVNQGDGSFVTTGLPRRMYPDINGNVTTNLMQNNYQLTNRFFNFCIRVPLDSGPTIYPAGGLVISSAENGGIGIFVTQTITYGGTNGNITLNQITNGLGFMPLAQTNLLALTNGFIELLDATNVANGLCTGLSNSLYSDYTTKIAVVSALVGTTSNFLYSDYTTKIALGFTNAYGTNLTTVLRVGQNIYIPTNWDIAGAAATVGGNATNLVNTTSNALQSQIVGGSVPASTVTNIAAFQAKIATNGITSLAYSNAATVVLTNIFPTITNSFVENLNGLATNLFISNSNGANGTTFTMDTNNSIHIGSNGLPNLMVLNPDGSSVFTRVNIPGASPTHTNDAVTAAGAAAIANASILAAFTGPVSIDALDAFTNTFGGAYSILGDSVIEGHLNFITGGAEVHLEGSGNSASGNRAHVEGLSNVASGSTAHVEGSANTGSGTTSHVEGSGNTASGTISHAAGQGAQATNNNSYVWADGTTTGSKTNKSFTVFAVNGINLLGGAINGNGGGVSNTWSTNLTGDALNQVTNAINTTSNFLALSNVASSNILAGLIAQRASTNAPLIWNPTNYGIVAISNMVSISNATLHDDRFLLSTINGDIAINPGRNFQVNFANDFNAFDNNFGDTIFAGNGNIQLTADGLSLTNGQIQLSAPGGVALISGTSTTFLYNPSIPPASGHTNVLLELHSGQVTNIDLNSFVLGSLFTEGITNLFGTNASVASVLNQVAMVPTNWDFRGGSNYLYGYGNTSSNFFYPYANNITNFLQVEKLNKTNDTSYGQSATNFSFDGNIGFGINGLSTNIIANTNYIAFVNAGSSIATNGAFIWQASIGCYTNWLTGAIYTNNGSAWLLQTNGVSLYSVAGSSPVGASTGVSGASPNPLAVWTAAINDHMINLGYFSVTNLNQLITNTVISSTNGFFIANNNGTGTGTALTNPAFIDWNQTLGHLTFDYAVFGRSNTLTGSGFGTAVLAGESNSIVLTGYSSIAGGGWNQLSGFGLNFCFIGGGLGNNIAGSTWATISGGQSNVIASGNGESTISGGGLNNISASSGYATITGGVNNTNAARGGTIVSGATNFISGAGVWSLAAGQQVSITNADCFVWSDGLPTRTITNSTVLLSATNGVGINTNFPAGYALNVNGNINATGFTVNGGPAGVATFNSFTTNTDSAAKQVVTNIINGAVVSSSVIETNFILNQIYTNTIGTPILVRDTANLTLAVVAGSAELDLFVDQTQSGTFVQKGTAKLLTSVAAALTGVSQLDVTGVVTNNGVYYWTNSSAGAGDSSALNAGSGQITRLP